MTWPDAASAGAESRKTLRKGMESVRNSLQRRFWISKARCRPGFALSFALVIGGAAGCGNDSSTNDGGSGITGGAASGGSNPARGGATSTGGAANGGYTSNSPMSGGKESGGATGGGLGAGGTSSSGGTMSNGGSSATAGCSAGGTGTGGAAGGSSGSGSGGKTSGSGGVAMGSGGRASTGGSTNGGMSAGGTSQGGTVNGGSSHSGGSAGAAGAAATFAPCPTTAGTPCSLLPLGDSITEGFGSSGGGYRVELFRQAAQNGKNITFVGSLQNGPTTVDGRTFPRRHEGHGGYTIDTDSSHSGISGSITDQAIANYHPHIVLLMIGTNDINGNVNVNAAPNRLGTLIDDITTRAPNALVVVATIIPIANDATNARVKPYNSAVAGVVSMRASAGKHVVLLDNYAAFSKDANYKTTLMYDYLHPNDAGYAVLGRAFYGAIGPVLPPQ